MEILYMQRCCSLLHANGITWGVTLNVCQGNGEGAPAGVSIIAPFRWSSDVKGTNYLPKSTNIQGFVRASLTMIEPSLNFAYDQFVYQSQLFWSPWANQILGNPTQPRTYKPDTGPGFRTNPDGTQNKHNMTIISLMNAEKQWGKTKKKMLIQYQQHSCIGASTHPTLYIGINNRFIHVRKCRKKQFTLTKIAKQHRYPQ